MKSVRFGVLGVGAMGRQHADYLHKKEIQGAELAALCDSRAEAMQPFDGVAKFPDAKALIKSGKADAILIATPHYDHVPQALAALKAGLHVMVEKPIAVTKKDALALAKARLKPGQAFGAMFVFRTDPAFRLAREILRSGQLGAVQRFQWTITNWFRSNAYYASGTWRATWKGEGGGILMNQAPHNLDLIAWLFGMPKRVRAFCSFGKYHPIEVEDEVTAYLDYAGGCSGVFIASTGEAPGTNRLEIAGDKGRLVLENGALQFTRLGVQASAFLKTSPEMFGRPPSSEVPLKVEGKAGMHREITQNFVDAILKGEPLLAPAAEGVHSVELANAMLLSTWTDKTVVLPLNAAAFSRELAKRVRRSKLPVRAKPAKMADFAVSFKV